jgi:UDP-2,3-diacylglucosamine hydrolase
MSTGPGLRALANVYECQAEPQWHSVEFISDLHLSDATPRTFEAWARYLRSTRADALFILGDLFEVWFDDDARSRRRRCGP